MRTVQDCSYIRGLSAPSSPSCSITSLWGSRKVVSHVHCLMVVFPPLRLLVAFSNTSGSRRFADLVPRCLLCWILGPFLSSTGDTIVAGYCLYVRRWIEFGHDTPPRSLSLTSARYKDKELLEDPVTVRFVRTAETLVQSCLMLRSDDSIFGTFSCTYFKIRVGLETYLDLDLNILCTKHPNDSHDWLLF